MARELLGDVADRAVGMAGDEAGEISRHRAGRRGDRHVVVVETTISREPIAPALFIAS